MFADIFNDLLAENELNKKQFAEKSGIPYTTVIGWTKLNRLPDYTALIKIADYFHCSVDYLTGRQDFINEENAPSVTQPVMLTQNEKRLVNSFRKLSPNMKKLVQQTVDAWNKLDDMQNDE